MNRKARTRRSKIPMSIRNGESGVVLLGGTDASERKAHPQPADQVAGTESSTAIAVGARPLAPTLTFSSTHAKPIDESDERAIDKPASEPAVSSHAAAEASDEARDSVVHPDDVSVPPIGLDSDFFGKDPGFSADASLEFDPRDPRIRKLTPLMAQRRARFAKYVTVAVSSAAILCAAAAVKITIARGTEATRGPANRTAMAEQAPLQAQEPAALPVEKTAVGEGTAAGPDPAPAPAESLEVAQGAPAQAAPDPAQPAPTPPQAEAPPGQAAAAAPSPVEGPAVPADVADLDPTALAKEANKAKARARGALEYGKMGAAIEAGERSVAIDPTDAEAWLILGAAYQQKGDAKNAVRSFKACLDQGKRGPRSECAAMMRLR